MDTIQSFEWQRGVTPLSSPYTMGATVVSYLVVVFAIKATLRKPVSVPGWVAALHNAVLCVWSLAMFAGCAWETLQAVQARGDAAWLVCMPPGTTAKGALFFWSYSYYVSKYYELLDTVLLALRGKPTSVLHVFHHTTVLPMAYLWLDQAQSLQQVGLLFNTAIHVIMYYYYASTSLGVYPSWKRLITTSQIVQFQFSFVASLPFWYVSFATPGHPRDACAGWGAMLFNAAFNALLLGLFVDFHRRTYAVRAAAAARNAKKGGKSA